MRFTQLVMLEAPGGCNLAHEHTLCPALSLGRDKPASNPMRADVAAQWGVQLAGMGFRGLYGFHWLSEPTTAIEWVDEVMLLIRAKVPTSRFVLWTNGRNIQKPERWKWASGFDRIFLSNYDRFDWHVLQKMCGSRLFVWQNPVHDPRMMTPNRKTWKGTILSTPDRMIACRRPYTEFPITRNGDVHLCCQAWRPEQRIGNVYEDGLEVCVERFLDLRTLAQNGACLKSGLCRECARPEPVIGNFEKDIAAETVKELDHD